MMCIKQVSFYTRSVSLRKSWEIALDLQDRLD